MNELFLTQQELIRLTGYKYKKHQCNWLSKNNIPFTKSRIKEPIVKRCLMSSNETVIIQQKEEMPNFENL